MTQCFAHIILAHGAGAGKDSPFMQDMARLITERGVKTTLFNFDYMNKAIELNKKRPPEKLPKLQTQFLAQIQLAHDTDNKLPIFIGGKSMGGRVASTILDTAPVSGCVGLGYPFHPPGKPDSLRTEHLESLIRPLLIIQGERDTFGTQREVENYSLDEHIQLHFLADGDHSFKPRKASGFSQSAHLVEAADTLVAFIKNTLSL